MGEIVNQMRSFSRRDSAEVVTFDPVPPVRRAIACWSAYASEGIALVTRTRPVRSRTAGTLEQVVIDLLSDARDAIVMRRENDGAAGGRIEVAAW